MCRSEECEKAAVAQILYSISRRILSVLIPGPRPVSGREDSQVFWMRKPIATKCGLARQGLIMFVSDPKKEETSD